MSIICLKTFREERIIKEIVPEYKAPVAWSYNSVAHNIAARFGDDLPKHFDRAMSKPQKQPYMYGDVHNIQYRTIRSILFNKPYPVPCQVTIKSCRKVDGVLTLGTYCVSGIDEPFPWMDNKYHVSLEFLRSLPNYTNLVIYTRSDLVATEDYVVELKRLNVKVFILYKSKYNEINRDQEPGAPSYERRSRAVTSLKECGIDACLKRHSQSIKKVG